MNSVSPLPSHSHPFAGGAARRMASLVALLLCSLVWLSLTTGCRSVKHLGSNRNAAVIITNHSPEAIEAATKQVFDSHRFEPGRAEGDELVFQRPGTFMNSMWYGDLYSGGVWMRVRVYQKPLDANRILLDADVFMVQEHDDPLFQKSYRVSGYSSPCQKLLKEVAARLKEQDAEPAKPKK